ncbi:hypothetical protein LTR37_001580 [Vermiconidia calcicola]|uniref:Uncharacterized protein n=1 Tax=Vermiconidia calcicola TaxID=1690605 RepID=A0ACC3NV53_9PEZI|nr:hypothetical protein LTR37_001580 [Vermiconidia calcicola]
MQRKLFLAADPSANEDTPVLNSMFLNDHFSAETAVGLKYNLNVPFSDLHRARRGSVVTPSYEHMLICQPPLNSFARDRDPPVQLAWLMVRSPYGREYGVYNRVDGVSTIGNLVDSIGQCLEDRPGRHCSEVYAWVAKPAPEFCVGLESM